MAVEDEIEAATPASRETEASEPSPQGFDMAAWVSGVRAVRHTVRLWARGDLLAELDVLRTQIRNAGLADDTKELAALRRQAGALVEEMDASALDVTVEARSRSWVKAFLEARQGMDEEERAIELVCAQIISPPDFTPALYHQLLEVIEPQVQQIAGAVMAANQQAVDVSVPS